MVELFRRPLAMLAVAAAVVLVAAPARADLVYALDQGSLDGQSSFGTVTLTQIQASTSIDPRGTIHVEVNLETPSPAQVVFAKTGAGEALTWNLDGVTNVDITNLTTGFSALPGPGRYKASPFGRFDYAISCTTGCGNGTSPPRNAGPLAFDISGDGLSFASFVANVHHGADVFFTTDLGVNGDTGVVGSNSAGVCQQNCGPSGGGSNAGTNVPEPASLLLLGSGAALLAVRRRRRRGA